MDLSKLSLGWVGLSIPNLKRFDEYATPLLS